MRRARSDDFCVFDWNGRTYVINEPWGDSSRYLIHQQPPQASDDLVAIRNAFEKYRPWWAIF